MYIIKYGWRCNSKPLSDLVSSTKIGRNVSGENLSDYSDISAQIASSRERYICLCTTYIYKLGQISSEVRLGANLPERTETKMSTVRTYHQHRGIITLGGCPGF